MESHVSLLILHKLNNSRSHCPLIDHSSSPRLIAAFDRCAVGWLAMYRHSTKLAATLLSAASELVNWPLRVGGRVLVVSTALLTRQQLAAHLLLQFILVVLGNRVIKALLQKLNVREQLLEKHYQHTAEYAAHDHITGMQTHSRDLQNAAWQCLQPAVGYALVTSLSSSIDALLRALLCRRLKAVLSALLLRQHTYLALSQYPTMRCLLLNSSANVETATAVCSSLITSAVSTAINTALAIATLQSLSSRPAVVGGSTLPVSSLLAASLAWALSVQAVSSCWCWLHRVYNTRLVEQTM